MNKKIIYMILISSTVILLGLLMKLNMSEIISYTIGSVAVISLILFKKNKETKNPTYYEDERSLSIAYKADSIAFRISILILAVLAFLSQGNNILNKIYFKDIGILLFAFMILSKFIIYYTLEKRD